MEDGTIRSIFVNTIIALTRSIFCWLPGGDPSYGIALMTFHPIFIGFWVAVFFLYPSHRPLRLLILGIACLVVLSQWVFKGCIVTRAEQFLTKTKRTVMDPFLDFLQITPTRDTRLAVTFGISISITSIMVLSVFLDSL